MTADPPSTQTFGPFNKYGYRARYPGCPSQVITSLMSSKAALKSRIAAMTADGWRLINIGAVWGFRLLAPEWQGLWGGEMDTHNLPLAYDSGISAKAVVIMTNGRNEMLPDVYTAYAYLSEGRLGYWTQEAAEDELDRRLTTVCGAMKSNGINVYTVTYGNAVDEETRDLLRQCASNDKFAFDAPSGSELSHAFTTIAESLIKLRINR